MEEPDLPQLFELYAHARKYMAETGNPHQWPKHYPSREILLQDMKNGGYVILAETQDNGKDDVQDETLNECNIQNQKDSSNREKPTIIGAFILEEDAHEPAYDTIDGQWLNHEPYAVIHRCATLHNQKGIGQFFMDWCFEKCSNIRVDTHKDNLPMIKFLEKNNFTHCGIVHYEGVGERLAYQRLL